MTRTLEAVQRFRLAVTRLRRVPRHSNRSVVWPVAATIAL